MKNQPNDTRSNSKLTKVVKYASILIGSLLLYGAILVICVITDSDKALTGFIAIGLAAIILGATILASRWMDSIPSKKPSDSSKDGSYSRRIYMVIVILGVTLPFHYVPDYMMVFPKDSLTFSNTIITRSDINRIIKRHNDASFWERQTIREEPLYRKLREKGLIVTAKEKPSDD